MAGQDDFSEEEARRQYTRPHSGKHPIPTVQKYRQHRKDLQAQLEGTEEAQREPQDESKPRRAYESTKAIFYDEDPPESNHDPYPTANRNRADRSKKNEEENGSNYTGRQDGWNKQSGDEAHGKSGHGSSGHQKSATETAAGTVDPLKKRRAMKHTKRTGGGREVTDPVTHLPLLIHDETDKDLENAPKNEPTSGSDHRTSTGLSGAGKSHDELRAEEKEINKGYAGMLKLFPPPEFDDTKAEFKRTFQLALTAGLGAVSALTVVGFVVLQLLTGTSRASSSTRAGSGWSSFLFTITSTTVVAAVMAGVAFFVIAGVRGWLGKKIEEIWDDEVWDASRSEEAETHETEVELPESAQWLNSLLASVWPLINPDLFASLIDTLEDVMQASLPRVVRMVSIDDMGQGSEAPRVLGVRWLPTGAASQSVDEEGNLKPPSKEKQSDRTTPGEGQTEEPNQRDDAGGDERSSPQQKKQQEQESQATREGLEAEEGDFVNMELALAYRARSSGKSLKTKAKNAHLYLKFYFPGGIIIPVWVEVRGLIATLRLRLQLTPDPPFFSLCTLTFLGQPKANLSCVPLSKRNLNIMDVPLISSFVQSAIDAALAEYVAPKSLTLDLKDMLVGDDFKKDTTSRGVVLVFIKKARDFKEGDGGIGPISGASDAYVTVSWGKFGKPVASTRIIVDDQQPNWHEWSSILVTPEELNAEEKLRLQLWDSDKWTADDDLGRVEVDLKDLMHDSKTKNRICEREDRFRGHGSDEMVPGTLTWAVGYFSKTRISKEQLEQQTVDSRIRTVAELKEDVSEAAEQKLREAKDQDHGKEIHQQKMQDYKEKEDAMIISAPPSPDNCSGILSVQIHNITGLEVQRLQKEQTEQSGNREDEAEQSDTLPDSYCTIILNHRKIYRTRTKPRNAKPFFNAGTERFVKDWKTTEIIVSVRDSRERENDALLGVVYLPLRKVFETRSQIMDTWPLVGGIGYGRARISLVWRSVESQLSPNLLGWDYGTLEVKSPVRAGGDLLDSLKHHRIKVKTTLARRRMYPVKSEGVSDAGRGGAEWRPRGKKDGNSIFLPVSNRYASPLMVEFRKSKFGPDKTPGFAVFWLSQLVDEEEQVVTAKVWKGGKANLKRARDCCDYQGLDENEQAIGEVDLTVKLWRGLSGYHKSYSNKSKNADVRDVMECLDTINSEDMGYDDDDDDDDDSDDSVDDDSDNEGHGHSRVPAPGQNESAEDAEKRRKLRVRTDEDKAKDRTGSSTSDMDTSPDAGSESDRSGLSKLKNPLRKIKDKVEDTLVGSSTQDDSTDGARGARAQVRDYKAHHKQLHRKHRGVMQWKAARTLDWMGGKVRRAKGKVGEAFEHDSEEKIQAIETEV